MKIFAIALIGATLLASPQTFSPDADGFIRNWLILAPIAFDDLGATAIDHLFLDDEPAIKPKPRDSVVIIKRRRRGSCTRRPTISSIFCRRFPSQASRLLPTASPM